MQEAIPLRVANSPGRTATKRLGEGISRENDKGASPGRRCFVGDGLHERLFRGPGHIRRDVAQIARRRNPGALIPSR